ncbi:MAG: hypothetical protein KAY24_09875 [Candidatus Eisenbacteria sp.]|nr:hypothetical protein [Candidatus Eisenbacteria bacterium]
MNCLAEGRGVGLVVQRVLIGFLITVFLGAASSVAHASCDAVLAKVIEACDAWCDVEWLLCEGAACDAIEQTAIRNAIYASCASGTCPDSSTWGQIYQRGIPLFGTAYCWGRNDDPTTFQQNVTQNGLGIGSHSCHDPPGGISCTRGEVSGIECKGWVSFVYKTGAGVDITWHGNTAAVYADPEASGFTVIDDFCDILPGDVLVSDHHMAVFEMEYPGGDGAWVYESAAVDYPPGSHEYIKDGTIWWYYTDDELAEWKAIRKRGMTGCPDTELCVFDLLESGKGRLRASWALRSDCFQAGTFVLSALDSYGEYVPGVRKEVPALPGQFFYDVEMKYMRGQYRLEVVFANKGRRVVLAEDFASPRP